MSDLIRRSDAVEVVKKMLGDLGEKVAVEINCLTGYVPTADRPHGEWEEIEDDDWSGGGKWVCTNCEYGYSFGAYFEVDKFNFCPNCGADMRGEEHECK